MRVVAVTGGKGGIGKTTISVNLAVAYAKAGKKVLVFDADLGLANVDILLGMRPQKTIHDFLSGQCDMQDICMVGPYGMKIIPASSGMQGMVDLDSESAVRIIHGISSLTADIDMMLIDLASGISKQVLEFTHAAENILVVLCNDPTSLMDSFAVIKILSQQYGRKKFGILINKVKNIKEGYQVFSRFQEIVVRFMNVSLEYIGYVPEDDYITYAARENTSIVNRYPLAPASKAFNDLQKCIHEWAATMPVTGGIQYFFEKWVRLDSNKVQECYKE